ncbi:MAG: hypothetical protein LAN59_16620 [Acidobacteriia bacterium]|nr:hypothetical protein [Terriglobia bacterium]
MHRARRRQCKSWYNDTWRDRLLAAVSFLSEEKSTLDIPVASGESIIMECRPMAFESQVAFSVISKKAIEESRAYDEGLENDGEEEQDSSEPGQMTGPDGPEDET